MFNVVFDIKNAYLQAEENKRSQGPKTSKRKEFNPNLQLDLEDFHIITSRSR